MGKLILKLLFISLVTFFVKSVLDVILQWTLVSLEVREHIWGRFTRSIGYIILDFIFHFWAYFMISILVYFIMYYFMKLRFSILYIFSLITVVLISLSKHNYEFPMKQYYFPSYERFNYILIQEIIMYTLSSFLMIYKIEKRFFRSYKR